MLLAIDIGNTRSKAAVFEGSSLLEHFVFPKMALRENILDIIEKHKTIADIALSSVSNESLDFEIPARINIHVISNAWPFPFLNLYETPLTLGIDRMVLASGAALQFPNQNRLVIDAGTCITYDFIDEKDHYHGGAISPGIQLRYQALHNYTAKLPLLSVEAPANYVGKSTAASIHSGVVNGVVHEIDGFINQYQQDYSNFIIILTGGDADFLAKRLKNTIFANSNFLLEGLNRTFQYKINND
ncbi:MAG TPA: type III pantothenate kinase [Flavobacterium sp.]|nr:type III pantothenate kinase [Flavobacterium sp.]